MTSSTCSSCRGRCPTPEACLQPERARQYHPDYEIEGPHRARRSRRLGLVAAAVVGGLFLVRAALRALGVF